jgi:hypothetical protein
MKRIKPKPVVWSTFPLVLLLLAGALLLASSLKVLYPNGGEVLKRDSTVTVRWQSTDLEGKVVIVLYKGGIKHSVISNQTDNSGIFPWKVPGNLPEGDDYRIRIRSIRDLSVNDFSDRNFTIN